MKGAYFKFADILTVIVAVSFFDFRAMWPPKKWISEAHSSPPPPPSPPHGFTHLKTTEEQKFLYIFISIPVDFPRKRSEMNLLSKIIVNVFLQSTNLPKMDCTTDKPWKRLKVLH